MSVGDLKQATARLVLVHRDIRITARRGDPVQAIVAGRSSLFAEVLLNRYRGCATAWRPLDLVFKKLRMLTSLRTHYFLSRPGTFWRLSLNVGAFAGSGIDRTYREVYVASFTPVQRKHWIRERVESAAVTRRVDLQTINRIWRDEPTKRQVSIAPPLDRGKTASVSQKPPIQPVGRVFRRSRSRAETELAEQRRPTTEAAESHAVGPLRPPGFVSAPGDSPAAQEIDVNRVTDHVMRAIDRRITAYRERLGRG